MAFGDDEEILQDFLIEAGEIIEQLSEQLVDLERRPDDKDLLNAIFRGFHTVKGGAGFLQLNEMVECCHLTENLFDILRNGQRQVTPELMDVVFQSLDTVTNQFSQLQKGESPTVASPELISALETLVNGDEIEVPNDPVPREHEDTDTDTDTDIDITDSEFEDFLDAINTEPEKPSTAAPITSSSAKVEDVKSSSDDEISDDEFESLLDSLHGEGKGPTAQIHKAENTSESVAQESKGAPGSKNFQDDEISDEEFENLLDQLHGPAKGPTSGTSKTPDTLSSASLSDDAQLSSSAEKAGNEPPSNDISDDEFEALLDQLHGKGKGPTANTEVPPVSQKLVDPFESKGSTTRSIPREAATVKSAPTASVAKSNVPPSANVSPPSAIPKDKLKEIVAAPQADTTVRVDTQRLDDIMNMVGELVLVRNRLVRLGLETSDEPMQKAVANLDVVTADLQSAVMKTRMQPIKKVFGRFPRVVRDLARNLKKEINLELLGEETDLDKNLVEALADPLVHLVRNSVDHGIEQPDVREKNGKPRIGKILLSAEQEGDHILLSIADDGGGMDPDVLRQKAIEKNILDSDAAARLTDLEAFNLIFAPGFSTKQEISDVSGRGVGMDVVKTKINQLNGSIQIDSKIGEGTRINIKVPLTLAIMPTLMIMLESQTFALPLVSVNEIFHMDLTKSNVVDGQECIGIRDKAVPIFHLKHWLIKNAVDYAMPKEGHVVIVSVGTQRVGFVVDQLVGQEEVVIKPLGKLLQGTPGMAGATITGDGTIALILDVPSMLKRYAGKE